MAKKKYTDIFDAIEHDDIEAVKTFLPDQLEDSDCDGWTPLHWASMTNCIEIVRLLLDSGADIEIKNECGETPLHSVCINGNKALIILLLEYGAKINARNDNGWTPLHYVCKDGNIEIVRLLLDNGADIEAKDEYGYTPLHFAVQWIELNISELLVSRGADPLAMDNIGDTVLQWDKEIVIDEFGNKVPHSQILVQLRADYLNKHTIDESERTAAITSGWEMEM